MVLLRSLAMCGLLVISSIANATSSYVKDEAIFYSDSSKATKLGDLHYATPINVEEQKGEFSKVTFQGWISQGAEEVVYSDVGVVLELALMTKDGMKQFKENATKTDDYKVKWTNITVTGWIESKYIMPSISQDWKELNILFSQRCSACHTAPEVGHVDINAWPSLLDAMSERAGLSKQEENKILKYLQFNTPKSH